MEDVETSAREHSFTIQGEPASKANSRKIVLFGKRPALIKSEKARKYVKQVEAQCEVLDDLFVGDVGVEMTIFYCTRRPDLDESVILDCMETYIYKNDRQVKEKIIRHGLDKENPRAVIRVYEL
jgi:Holliday junction resolvase RusA-like endonuclease